MCRPIKKRTDGSYVVAEDLRVVCPDIGQAVCSECGEPLIDGMAYSPAGNPDAVYCSRCMDKKLRI